MELWFSDYHTEKVKVSVKVQKQLFGLQTEFQRIDVFDSDEFGRFLSSDGSIVFSEKDIILKTSDEFPDKTNRKQNNKGKK